MEKRGRGRPRGFIMSEEHRAKIANSQILKRLIECAEGKMEMTATQASVGVALLKKVMPDLNNIQISGDEENPLEVVHRVELVDGHSADRSPSEA